jgi:chromosome segregation ATPase
LKATDLLKRKYDAIDTEVVERLEKFNQVTEEHQRLKTVFESLKREEEDYATRLTEFNREKEKLQQLTEINRKLDELQIRHKEKISELISVCILDIHTKLTCLADEWRGGLSICRKKYNWALLCSV